MSGDAKERFTGERFIPGVEDDEITIEHYQRYESILDIVKGKVVVDAACGEGYGTSVIGSVASSVLGIDIDEETVAYAKKKYENEKIRFEVGSVEKINLPDESVDVFVSFETIEHVPENIQKAFVAEAARVLKADGIFVISSPNKAIYSDYFSYNNKFHVHELYKEEFLGMLGEYFPYVKLSNQYLEVASFIDCNDDIKKHSLYKKDTGSYVSDGKYFIAFASKSDIELPSVQSVYLKKNVTYRENMKRIIDLQNEEEARNRHLEELNRDIAAKDKRIVELQAEEEKRNEHLKKLDGEIAEKNSYIQDLQASQNALVKHIERCDNELESKNAEIKAALEKIEVLEYAKRKLEKAVYDKDVHIRNLEAMITIRDGVVAEREGVIAQRDAQIQSMEPAYNKWMKLRGSVVGKAYRAPKTVARVVYHKAQESKAKKNVEKLVVPQCDTPEVSIVIPVYNQFDYTFACIKSIIENTGDVKYEIIVGDDVSTDETKNIGSRIKGIRVIRNKTNLKFLLNCNNAAKFAKGKYILFLNNDTQVRENWLSGMVRLMEKDETIGMTGSKLIYPDGRLQEAGGIIWKDGSAWNYGNGEDPDAVPFNYVREVDYISGASIMIRSKLWKKLGGFDERFAPAYCEDSDLAFQVRAAGYKVVYQPESVVVHFEGVSNGTDTSTGLKHYQVVNSEKLKEKWADELKTHFNNGEHVLKAKDRCYGDGKTILFIDHYVPQFDKDAGSRTVYQYVKMFVKKGYMVKFIGDNYFKHEPYTTILNQMGVEVLHGPWYAQNIFTWLTDNAGDIDYVFMNRPHITEKYIDFFKEHTKCKLIYYGHDLHFLRITREYELSGDEEKRLEAAEWKEKEMDIMYKADVVYYPSDVEAKLLKSIDSGINVKALVPYVYDEFREYDRTSSKNNGILFVGGFAHTPNIDAVLWFAEHVYTKIKAKADIPFYIVGSNPTDEIKALDEKDGISVKGFVSDEELKMLYDTCKLVVVPLRYGAGVKGKVVEAMYNGVPIVTTAVGAEGIPDCEDVLVIKDTPDEFADAVVDLYGKDKKLDEISKKMQAYIKQHNSVDAAWKVVGKDFQ